MSKPANNQSTIKAWLTHPLTREMDLDDPRTTQLRRRIIGEKSFLRRIYQEWYTALAAALPQGRGAILEIGSGAGFLDEYIPGLITSEIFYCPGISAVLDGQQLPFAEGVLRGIVMTDVLHHLPQPRAFLSEAARCVQPGGVLVMIEPWVNRQRRSGSSHPAGRFLAPIPRSPGSSLNATGRNLSGNFPNGKSGKSGRKCPSDIWCLAGFPCWR
jgi:SAM-dependent methyltransferase